MNCGSAISAFVTGHFHGERLHGMRSYLDGNISGRPGRGTQRYWDWALAAESRERLSLWLNSIELFQKKPSPATSISLDLQVIIIDGKKENIFPPLEKIRWLPLLPLGLLFFGLPVLYAPPALP